MKQAHGRTKEGTQCILNYSGATLASLALPPVQLPWRRRAALHPVSLAPSSSSFSCGVIKTTLTFKQTHGIRHDPGLSQAVTPRDIDPKGPALASSTTPPPYVTLPGRDEDQGRKKKKRTSEDNEAETKERDQMSDLALEPLRVKDVARLKGWEK